MECKTTQKTDENIDHKITEKRESNKSEDEK